MRKIDCFTNSFRFLETPELIRYVRCDAAELSPLEAELLNRLQELAPFSELAASQDGADVEKYFDLGQLAEGYGFVNEAAITAACDAQEFMDYFERARDELIDLKDALKKSRSETLRGFAYRVEYILEEFERLHKV